MMKNARESELVNFFWYCRLAVMILDELPDKTVPKAMALRTLRMATLCATGRYGIEYASASARDRLNRQELAGLVREHVIPVRQVRDLGVEELKNNREIVEMAEEEAQLFPSEAVDGFKRYPRAWQAARIILKWNLLAWVTEAEHVKLKDEGLAQSMPRGWAEGDDRFARYVHCSIKLFPVGVVRTGVRVDFCVGSAPDAHIGAKSPL